MKQINSAREYKGKNAAIYFFSLTDNDIIELIEACEQELELRSQENMEVSEQREDNV